MPKIHPTAIVDAAAELADDVEVGPGCIVERDVKIGAGSVLRQHCIVRRYTTLGSGNFVDPFTVLGGEPQDFKFDKSTVSYLKIGDNNVFREGVTISRATGEGNSTIIGNNNYFMTAAHVGHNSIMHDNCIMVNGSCLAGHVELNSNAILSAHSAVHQFCWIGRMTMFQGNSIATMHLPPFTMIAGVNNVVGLNTVGLRRNPEFSEIDRRQVKEAFTITYRSGLPTSKAIAEMDKHTEWGKAAIEFREFVRKAVTAAKPNARGICPFRNRAASNEE